MGLDFTHCDACWSYGTFHVFRCFLAEAIGINLDETNGFDGNGSWDGITDPILGLLNHSDCDGELSPEQCRVIAPRLRELVEILSVDPEFREDHRDQALELADGMDSAAATNEPLTFC